MGCWIQRRRRMMLLKAEWEVRNETDEDTMEEKENVKIDLTTASLTNAASTFTSYDVFGLLCGILASCLIMT